MDMAKGLTDEKSMRGTQVEIGKRWTENGKRQTAIKDMAMEMTTKESMRKM